MKPNLKLAEAKTPDGARLTLHEHDGSFCIRLNGHDLMHSKVTASETLLGELIATASRDRKNPRLLVGGLGLGFTLKSILDQSPASATVEVVELLPEIADWNRRFLSGVNGSLLSDPRVKLTVGDVVEVLARHPGQYDGVALDIDNGPCAMVRKTNSRLYDRRGIARIARALKPGGSAAIWSAGKDPAFEEGLKKGGFFVQKVPARLHPAAKRFSCTIYLAEKSRCGTEADSATMKVVPAPFR